MRTNFDLAPFRSTSVGFDRLFELLESGPDDAHPAFDIELDGGDGYRITMAVPGYRRDEIEITTKPNMLVVTGRKAEDADRKYVHRGIRSGSFERRFALGDYVQARGAELRDGLLLVALVRDIPEEMKPRRIEIGTSPGGGTTDQRQAA